MGVGEAHPKHATFFLLSCCKNIAAWGCTGTEERWACLNGTGRREARAGSAALGRMHTLVASDPQADAAPWSHVACPIVTGTPGARELAGSFIALEILESLCLPNPLTCLAAGGRRMMRVRHQLLSISNVYLIIPVDKAL